MNTPRGPILVVNNLQKNKVQQAEKGREGTPGSRSLVEALRLQGLPKRWGGVGVGCGSDPGCAYGSGGGGAVVKVRMEDRWG